MHTKGVIREPYYLFRSLYRNAVRYVSNKIDPPVIFILLSISSQNLHKVYLNYISFILQETTIEESIIKH